MFFLDKIDKVFVYVSKMIQSLVKCVTFLSIILLGASGLQAQNQQTVDGTTGTPLGGIGAGAVKFNASKGSFAIMTRPPADAYDFKIVKNAYFQIFTQRNNHVETLQVLKAQTLNGKINDDAIWPLHLVDFGKTNGIKLEMCAFSPFDNVDYNKMVLPYSFYELSVSNIENSSVEISIALQWNAGKDKFQVVAGKGIASETHAVFASTAGKSIITSGDQTDNLFFLKGFCNDVVSESVAKVSVKIKLKPHETRKINYVIAWYNKTDPELAYYFNLYKTPAEISGFGLANFQKLKQNAVSIVDKFRTSNLPDWLKNQTLNTLSNLTTNSMYKKDGRFAFAEGQWTCFGTMDQMWHARQIIGQILPFFAWQELRYWALTQMKNGQIHHDHNLMNSGGEKEKRSLMVDWDDTEHDDYRNIDKWVDLNAAMIVSVYEIYQMTNDKKQMNFFWPYLKKAANRMIDQVTLYGSKEYPFTFDQSENSYDAGGDPNPFNASISAVAYKIMQEFGREFGEPEISVLYDSAYKQVVNSFEKRYLFDDKFKTGKYCESYFSGQWLALHLQLGEIWSAEKTDYVLDKLDSYYHPFYWGLGNENGTYEEWTPYVLTHYGGLLLNTKRENQWYVLQKDAYERQFLNKDYVFDHPLNILPKIKVSKEIASSVSSDKQYISIPAIWRNYYDIVGLYQDKRKNEIRIKPKLIDSIGVVLKDMMVFTPQGNAYLSCTFSGTSGQNKNIFLRYDYSNQVDRIILEDNFGKNIDVLIDGRKYQFSRKGSGYAKELWIDWNGKIGKKGINIHITGDEDKMKPLVPLRPETKTFDNQTQQLLNGKDTLLAVNATVKTGVKVEKLPDGNSFISSCNNFDYIQFSNVDFGNSTVTSLTANAASPFDDVNLEIVLGNVAGEVIGNCIIQGTGSYQNYQNFTCPLKKITGVQTIVLRFSGTISDNLMNLRNISFK